jgi:hypothetical protein
LANSYSVADSLPDWICIGFHKCGTTSLVRKLERHPGVFLADSGADHARHEFHWFHGKNAKQPIEWYKSFFADKKGRSGGEKTPAYILHETALIKMREIVPQVRLIVCIREPSAAIYSSYNHAMQHPHSLFGWKKDVSFHDQITHANFVGSFEERSRHYVTWITNLLKYFNREQILVLPLENADDKKLLDHLGVPLLELPQFHTHKRSYAALVDQHDEDFLKDRYRISNDKLFDWLGYDISEWK